MTPGPFVLKLDIILVKKKKKKKKKNVIRVVFQDQATRVHCLGVQKLAKLKKKSVFLVTLTNFGKDMTDKLRKTHAKTRI